MILRLTNKIWVGDSGAEQLADLHKFGVTAVLNVAHDLVSRRKWPEFATAHIGLVDGPGNEPEAYVAAVWALRALLKEHGVLLVCHSGGRAAAVAVMHLAIMRAHSWDEALQAVEENTEGLPPINEAHRKAYGIVRELLGT